MTARQSIATIDVHAAGEPGRVLIGSHLLARGSTMAEKLEYAQHELEWLRRLVLREPRGYPAMCAILVTAPCDPRADVGIIVLEQAGFRPMSGSNTMCTVTALLETGMLPVTGHQQTVVIDTAVGLVEATATVADGKVTDVAIRNVPSFVEVLDHPLEVPELGTLSVDVVFGGQFFVQARAADAGVSLEPIAGKSITRVGALIRAAARQQIPVKHPDNPNICTIDLVMLHGPSPNPGVSGRNAVICCNAEVDLADPATWTGSVDRSPCGTGTCGRMAAKYARGELGLGESFVHESILGTCFTGHLTELVADHPRDAVRPVISGQAWVSGTGRLLLDDSDPFPQGYTLGDLWAL
ncbi:proline racemase family protein [Kribbella sp. NPDC050124]|uniref:proline racemase family protein n=1 Tax=Kribbella sp. NPDC050124 TaxID=3364114 RepID=UPI0037BDD133